MSEKHYTGPKALESFKEEMMSLADAISYGFSNPIREGELEAAYKQGMLRIDQLVDGKYYLGTCRNASIACWSAEHQTFAYMRQKFGSTFAEEIEHPANDDNYDLFVPVLAWDPEPRQVIEPNFFRQKSARKSTITEEE